MNEDNRQELSQRLGRLIGQLEAVKRGIDENGICGCLDTMHQVKAAGNALKKFSEAYVKSYMKDCMRHKTGKTELEKELEEIVSAAFSM